MVFSTSIYLRVILTLSQYNIVSADRKSENEKFKHGGCQIGVSNNASFDEVNFCHLSDVIQESLVVIKLNQPEPAIIARFYNPTKGSPIVLNKTILMLVFAFYQFSLIKKIPLRVILT